MSELGSSGVAMLVTQPAWPTSVPRIVSCSAILLYLASDGARDLRGLLVKLLLAAGLLLVAVAGFLCKQLLPCRVPYLKVPRNRPLAHANL